MLENTTHTNCRRSVSMVELPTFESTIKSVCKVKLEEVLENHMLFSLTFVFPYVSLCFLANLCVYNADV